MSLLHPVALEAVENFNLGLTQPSPSRTQETPQLAVVVHLV